MFVFTGAQTVTYKTDLFRKHYNIVLYSLKMVKNFYRKMFEEYFLCFVDCESRFNLVKINQLEAQFILSIFRQSLYVLGIS